MDAMLALILLLAPTDPPDEQAIIPLYLFAAPSMQAIAIDWQILDPREARFVLTNADNFAGDVSLLRRRFKELRNAPRVEECERFPPAELIAQLKEFNRQYRHDLHLRMALDRIHADELSAVIAENDQLYRIWDTLRDAQTTYYYVTVRRTSLMGLRDMLGYSAFYAGRMPPHVPTWRLPEH